MGDRQGKLGALSLCLLVGTLICDRPSQYSIRGKKTLNDYIHTRTHTLTCSKVHGVDQWLLSDSFTEAKFTSTSVSTWMGDHQGRGGAVYLFPFVGVDFDLRPIVQILVIEETRTLNECTLRSVFVVTITGPYQTNQIKVVSTAPGWMDSKFTHLLYQKAKECACREICNREFNLRFHVPSQTDFYAEYGNTFPKSDSLRTKCDIHYAPHSKRTGKASWKPAKLLLATSWK